MFAEILRKSCGVRDEEAAFLGPGMQNTQQFFTDFTVSCWEVSPMAGREVTSAEIQLVVAEAEKSPWAEHIVLTDIHSRTDIDSVKTIVVIIITTSPFSQTVFIKFMWDFKAEAGEILLQAMQSTGGQERSLRPVLAIVGPILALSSMIHDCVLHQWCLAVSSWVLCLLTWPNHSNFHRPAVVKRGS
ncbi:uncharacterized protein [Littorina saxatilis]|uniref:uncharacterized protein n=1 Tax=Littorina saxatilis TaxID=31220 RepID=UPI0038B4B0A9